MSWAVKLRAKLAWPSLSSKAGGQRGRTSTSKADAASADGDCLAVSQDACIPGHELTTSSRELASSSEGESARTSAMSAMQQSGSTLSSSSSSRISFESSQHTAGEYSGGRLCCDSTGQNSDSSLSRSSSDIHMHIIVGDGSGKAETSHGTGRNARVSISCPAIEEEEASVGTLEWSSGSRTPVLQHTRRSSEDFASTGVPSPRSRRSSQLSTHPPLPAPIAVTVSQRSCGHRPLDASDAAALWAASQFFQSLAKSNTSSEAPQAPAAVAKQPPQRLSQSDPIPICHAAGASKSAPQSPKASTSGAISSSSSLVPPRSSSVHRRRSFAALRRKSVSTMPTIASDEALQLPAEAQSPVRPVAPWDERAIRHGLIVVGGPAEAGGSPTAAAAATRRRRASWHEQIMAQQAQAVGTTVCIGRRASGTKSRRAEHAEAQSDDVMVML